MRVVSQQFYRNILLVPKYLQLTKSIKYNAGYDKLRLKIKPIPEYTEGQGDSLPPEHYLDKKELEPQEIQTRILKVLKGFEEVNIRNLNWDKKFPEIGLDSLNQVAAIVSIEHEFKVVFPDHVFDHFYTLNDVINYLKLEKQAF